MASSPFLIFVTNLKSSVDLRANISKQLEILKLDYQFIEAVDEAQFTHYEIIESRVNRFSTLIHINLISRFVFNLPMLFCIASFYLVQDINHTLYYGKKFSTIRVYTKKTGLFRYSQAI